METLQRINELKKKLNEYINIKSSLPQSEKDLIQTFPKLLEYFYYSFLDMLQKSQAHNAQLSLIKNEILDDLNKKGYTKEEFHILGTEVFDESDKYLSTLINNFYYYFSNYQQDINLFNIYYYIFHLIYYILVIIGNTFDKNPFEDSYIKFYIYHIIHIFNKKSNLPKYYFYFYEGAFKFLSKNYNITIKYIFSLDNNFLSIVQFMNEITSIRDTFYNKIINKNENKKNENDLYLISNYGKIKNEIDNILYENIREISSNDINGNILKICEIMLDKIQKIENIFKNIGIICDELLDYKNKLKEISEVITKYNLTNGHFFLMYKNYDCCSYNFGTFYYCVQNWKKYNKELNVDYTKIFSDIINSKSFKELYLTAMKSSFINYFAIENKLQDNYNLFMDKYAKEIEKYILYVTLPRGIKANTSNYFRIALNINSIELIGEFNEAQKIEIYKSYLLIQLIRESFHFLFRLNKIDYLCHKVLSPVRKKIIQEYSDIGVDIILYLFGTEYITFISLENCKLLNSLESWENEKTDFKVFKRAYLMGEELIIDGENENLSVDKIGLNCNISLYESNNIDSKICADSAIRYCF